MEDIRSSMRNLKIIGVFVLLIAGWYFSPLYALTVYPAAYETAASPVDVYREPEQKETSEAEFSFRDRKGQTVTIFPVATYEINARVAINETYPNYFNLERLDDLLTNDFALVWGKFAEDRVMKKVTFAHQFAYSTFRFYDEAIGRDPGLQYMAEHFSSNHLVSANKNIDHAIRRTGKYDRIRIKGYLIDIKIPGFDLIQTSRTRTDNWTPGEGNHGGSEFIYVTEFQNGARLYK